MALNIVRGFRRIGWVVTFPLAGILAFTLLDWTKQFSEVGYEAESMTDVPAGFMIDSAPGKYVVEIPSVGRGVFPNEVPPDIAAKVVKDFAEKQRRERDQHASQDSVPVAPEHKPISTELKTYKVQAPDGKIIQVQGPNGASDEEVIRLAQRLYPANSEPGSQSSSASHEDWFAQNAPDRSPTKGTKKNVDEIAAKYGGTVVPVNWQFTVYKKVSKLRLLELLTASTAVSTLSIQGLIALVVWVIRGFISDRRTRPEAAS